MLTLKTDQAQRFYDNQAVDQLLVTQVPCLPLTQPTLWGETRFSMHGWSISPVGACRLMSG